MFYLVCRGTEKSFEDAVIKRQRQCQTGSSYTSDLIFPFITLGTMKSVGDTFEKPIDIRKIYRDPKYGFRYRDDQEWIRQFEPQNETFTHIVMPNGMYELFFMECEEFDKLKAHQKANENQSISAFQNPKYADWIGRVSL